MLKGTRHGFTLIELLVVIAIIGILATIVLTSLGTARKRAQDARIKEELSHVRVAAEAYFVANTSFTGVCPSPEVHKLITDIIQSLNTFAGCDSINNSWYAAADLPSDPMIFNLFDQSTYSAKLWCVDGNGFSGEVTGSDLVAASPNFVCK